MGLQVEFQGKQVKIEEVVLHDQYVHQVGVEVVHGPLQRGGSLELDLGQQRHLCGTQLELDLQHQRGPT